MSVASTDAEALLSVIIPMRNAADTVGDTIRSLMEQETSAPWEVIIVDNGSVDGSPIVAKRAVPGVDLRPDTLLRTVVTSYPDRVGHASPRNRGVALASGRFLAFCDADDLVSPCWLEEIRKALQRHPYVASRQVRLGDAADLTQTDGIPAQFGAPAAYGSGLACSRALFDAVGGFDPAFDSGGEDGDFTIRARRLGIAPVLADKAVYYFRLRRTPRASFWQGYRDGGTYVRLYHAHRDLLDESRLRARIVPYRLASAARTTLRGRDRSSLLMGLRMAGYALGRATWSVRLRESCF